MLAGVGRVPSGPGVLREVSGRSGVGLGSVWGRFGIDLGSVWGRSGVGSGLVWDYYIYIYIYVCFCCFVCVGGDRRPLILTLEMNIFKMRAILEETKLCAHFENVYFRSRH